MTSAPMSASIWPAQGPASTRASSMTRIPESGGFLAVSVILCRSWGYGSPGIFGYRLGGRRPAFAPDDGGAGADEDGNAEPFDRIGEVAEDQPAEQRGRDDLEILQWCDDGG